MFFLSKYTIKKIVNISQKNRNNKTHTSCFVDNYIHNSKIKTKIWLTHVKLLMKQPTKNKLNKDES